MVTVNSQVFTEAYQNKNNLNIIKYVTKKFGKQLDYDTLIECGMTGLLNCLYYHNESKSKFTTNLYRFVMWECRRALKKVEKDKNITSLCKPIHNNLLWFSDINIDEYLEGLGKDTKEIVIQHVIYKQPFTIIAKELNLELYVVKRLYKYAINKLKNELCQ